MAHTNQGGVKNYLGNQKMVKAPLHWQSAPNHPKTELAYITDAEKKLLIKKDLHKSLKGGVNRGPSGIMSLNGWGSSDSSQNRAGADISASMDRSGSDAGWSAPGGHTSPHAKSPAELKAIADQAGSSTVMPESFYGRTYKQPRSGLGGLLGSLGRGALGFFGGIPGKLLSGIMSARNLAKRTGAKIGEFGEEVDEFSQYPTLDRYINRNTGKYKDKPYKGQGQGYNFSNAGQGNNLGLYTNTLGAPMGPGKRVGEDKGYYGMGSQYDQSVMPNNLTGNMGANNFNNTVPNNELFTDNNLMAFKTGSPLDLKINQAHNIYNETGFGQNNLQDLMKMDIENKEKTGDPLSLPANTYTMFGADGGIARLL